MQRLLALFLFIGFGANAQIDVQHYRFELELSDRSDAITGKATITIAFTADASRIALDLTSTDNDKGMQAFSVKQDGQDRHWTHQADRLLIDLARPAKKGETHTFEIEYMGTPKDGLIIAKNKYGDRTFFADNWPNRAHNWIPCNDRPDDKASFEFIVTAPDHYRIISNGLKTAEQSLDGHRRRTSWNETTALPTKVMVIGAANFAVREFGDSPAGLPVSAWVYPQDSTKGFYDYALAPSILKFFTSYIAPFPYRKLANVQSKTIFGGMENAGAIFYAEESVTGDRKWEEVLAHEIAHQWFGDMASEKSFAHLWLSEGFATYLTDMYIGGKYGRDSALARLRKERSDVIAFTHSNDHAVVDSTADLMSLLNANSYQKGGWVLRMLHQRAGDSLFRTIIQSYYAAFRGGNADTRDFERIAERVLHTDLHVFFDQWLYRPGIPQLEVRSRVVKGGMEIRIKQLQKDLYVLPVELRIAEGSPVKEIILNDRETVITLPVAGKVVLDPDVKLLFEEK